MKVVGRRRPLVPVVPRGSPGEQGRTFACFQYQIGDRGVENLVTVILGAD